MSFGVFSSWFPSSNTVSCVEAVYFVSFLHEVAITSRIVHTVVRSTNNLYAYKLGICLIMFGQKDHLHSADATTIPVDSFRRDLWMFVYEAYFVWLPTMYFHCAGCVHLCPGLRSLGCGWLWDECSPCLLGSRKPSTFHSSCTYLAICGLKWWVRVYLYLFGSRCCQKATVLWCIVIRTHLAMKFIVSTSMYCYNFLADTLLWLCSLQHCMHWSWSAKISHNLKKSWKT